MDLIYCKKFNTKSLFIVGVGVLLASAFLFYFIAQAQTDADNEAQIKAAIEDLSSVTGQTIASEEEARNLCNLEQYLDVCADIGKKHDLYTPEEEKHVDDFLIEVKGKILDDIKTCPDEECLIRVANELAKKIQIKNPTLATDFKLTATLIQEKNSVVQAAKEAGVDFRDCESMDPDTASIELLRQCAKLAKDSRIQKYIPEDKRVLADQFSDTTLVLREGLRSGKYQCGDNTLEGCGNYCLNPSVASIGAGIPEVCKQIATEVFGPDGVKQLESAHQQVGQVRDYYSKKFILTLPDGRELVGEGQIRNACDQAFSGRNLEIARACGAFAVQNGFAAQAEVDKGLKLMESFAGKAQNVNFDECLANPTACRDFIPEDERNRFDAGNQIFQIMKEEIGFDPSQCERGSVDQTIGDKCFEGSKRALAKIESLGLANQSPEARFIIEDIRRHVSEGDDLTQKREQFREVFSQQGGPGGCKSEAECFNYCSNPTNGPECIAFGAQQGVSGFRGDQAVQKFQEYNQNIQKQGFISDEYRPYPPGGQYPQYPGQGPYPGYQPPGQVPGFTQPGPGFSPPPGTLPYYPPFPGGPGPGPVGPSPECFAAIQSGDFVKAKAVCEVHTPSQPFPSGPVCPASPYVQCPAGEYRESYRNNDGCWIDGPCKPAPTYSYSPYPTYSGGPYPTYTPGSGGWINKTWKFKDGSTQFSSILNRTDSEYTTFVNGVYNDCSNKYFAGWKPGGGNDSNWQEFGIPVCSLTASTPTYSPYPTGPYPTYSPYPTSTGGTGEMYSCFYPNVTKNGAYVGYTVWCEKDYFNCHEGSKTGPTISLSGISLGAPSSCERGYQGQSCNNNGFCDSNETTTSCPSDCKGSTYSPYPSYSSGPGGSTCSQSLRNLLGDGCHWMYSDSTGRGIYCDGPMTKSAKEGDAATTTGCSGGGATYSPYPSYSPPVGTGSCPSGYHYHGESGGFCMNDREDYSGTCYNASGTSTITCPVQPSYSPYPTYSPTSSGSCPSGAHTMYVNGAGGYCMSDSDGTKCGPLNSTSVSSFGSCSSYQSTTSYTPTPSCPAGQWWDYSTNSCKSNTSYGGCTGTSQSSCTSASNCYWSSSGNYCYYQSTPSGTTTYTPYPSCPAGQWWDYSSSTCKSNDSYTYTPYPTSSYTPPPSCSSTQYWNGSSCVDNATTTYTPYPTTDPSASCTSSGGTWNGSSCVYPTPTPAPTPAPTPEPTPPPPTSSMYQPYMVAHCQELDRTWNGSICRANGLFARIYESYTSDFATILKAFGF